MEYARILGVSKSGTNGYFENEKWIVTWTIGHLVTMSYPEKYNSSLKEWTLEALPFIPEQYEIVSGIERMVKKSEYDKIWDKREELIGENINENNINGSDDNKLYEIRSDVAGGIGVLEYNKTYDNTTYLTVKETELPKSVDKGMFFRKVDGNYIFDRETTEKIYNEMINFQNKLISQQKKVHFFGY